MAKGLRSTVRKRNKAKLRATVYGPVVDSRTERLSAKLQDLVSNHKPTDPDPADMQIDNNTGAWFLCLDPSPRLLFMNISTLSMLLIYVHIDKMQHPDEPKSKDQKSVDGMLDNFIKTTSFSWLTFQPTCYPNVAISRTAI